MKTIREIIAFPIFILGFIVIFISALVGGKDFHKDYILSLLNKK